MLFVSVRSAVRVGLREVGCHEIRSEAGLCVRRAKYRQTAIAAHRLWASRQRERERERERERDDKRERERASEREVTRE